jgi:hypothetical protein
LAEEGVNMRVPTNWYTRRSAKQHKNVRWGAFGASRFADEQARISISLSAATDDGTTKKLFLDMSLEEAHELHGRLADIIGRAQRMLKGEKD